MNKLEILKAQYQIIRDKLMLFSASVGGCFITYFNINLPLYGKITLETAFIASLIGMLINLFKAGKILNKIKKLEDKNDW